MKRLVAIVSASLVALATTGFGAAYLYVAYPTASSNQLPAHTISLASRQGRTMAEESQYRADLVPVQTHFAPQIYRSYCGVATTATVLRAFGEKSRQDTFFETGDPTPISGWNVFFSGLTLEELADLLEARGREVEIRHADEVSLDQFRAEAKRNLESPENFVIVNYLRSAAGQRGGGHISPVAAYHAERDRFLVFDTADYKYPPFWLPTDTLFEAMATKDAASGRARGYLLVEE